MQNIIALDIGLKRIGIAQFLQNIPIPLPPILRKNRNQAARDVSNLIQMKNPQILVIGIPQDGDSSLEMERRIKHFINLLEIPKGIEICFIDESFISCEALQKMQGSKKNKKKDGSLDSLAALIILERYLMSQKQD